MAVLSLSSHSSNDEVLIVVVMGTIALHKEEEVEERLHIPGTKECQQDEEEEDQ